MIFRWFLNALALIFVSYLVPGFDVTSVGSALVAALILGLVNVFIRPILLVLTLPINLLTLGIFTLVINALMLELVSGIVKGFNISSFGAALLGAILLWIWSMLVDSFFRAKPVE